MGRAARRFDSYRSGDLCPGQPCVGKPQGDPTPAGGPHPPPPPHAPPDIYLAPSALHSSLLCGRCPIASCVLLLSGPPPPPPRLSGKNPSSGSANRLRLEAGGTRRCQALHGRLRNLHGRSGCSDFPHSSRVSSTQAT